MCGRFTQSSETEKLVARFAVGRVRAEARPGFNIAPSEGVCVVVAEAGLRILDELAWGLVPAWARALDDGPRPINARSETAAKSALFRRLLPSRRCLVLADGYYEWSGPKGRKVPYRVQLASGETFAFAGLWDAWRPRDSPAEPELRTCTILTTSANPLVATIHDRMPAILAPRDEPAWLDQALSDPASLSRFLRPHPADAMRLYRVSSLVNDARHKDADCVAPA